jgi:hypothetical protein
MEEYRTPLERFATTYGESVVGICESEAVWEQMFCRIRESPFYH